MNKAVIGVISVTLLLGTIVHFSIQSVKNSDYWKVATNYCQNDAVLMDITGPVLGYSYFISEVSSEEDDGREQAMLEFTIQGENRDFPVMVYLEKQPEADWKVIHLIHLK